MKEDPEASQAFAPDANLPAALQPFFELPLLELRRGDSCPNCEQGVLDYDGMLNLGCQICGFSLVGCFT
jgi:hypothetical protein